MGARGREQFAVRGREEQFAVRGMRNSGRKEEDACGGGHHGRGVREEQFAVRGVRDVGRKEGDARGGRARGALPAGS